ncbi:lipase family protein [Pseudarthrobacter sp. N5]|uniref:lipase family protein n=1 Tax=Pseudarthrobacter sp. N5 TaxID=3418416 RepID=UPI003CF43B96
MPALDEVVANGGVLVAADYPGLGTAGSQPYLLGKGEGQAVLDSVRAAKELLSGETATGQTTIWGHSQGGHAEMSSRCLSEPGVLVSVLAALSLDRDRNFFKTDPGTGSFGKRLADNTPAGRTAPNAEKTTWDWSPETRPSLESS